MGQSATKSDARQWLLAREFAELAGVTVRTLHHYDHCGLLKPRRRFGNGYRMYHMNDLERLEQIVALKFLGLPLGEIRGVIESKPLSLAQALARQRAGLLEKRRLLDRALLAIGDAESAMANGKPTVEMLRRIIEAIEMQNDSNWMMKYYSPSAQAKISERAKAFTPEMQVVISRAWKEYYRDLNALEKDGDPNGSKACELEQRHKELIAAFTGNDPEIEGGLRALYEDHVNWPAEMRDRMKEFARG